MSDEPRPSSNTPTNVRSVTVPHLFGQNVRHERGNVERGITIVELFVALAGMAALGALVITIYISLYQGLAVLSVRSMVTGDLRNCVEQIGQDVRASQGVVASCGAYSTTGTALVLQMGSGAPWPRVVYQCNPSGGCNGIANQLQRITFSDVSCGTQTDSHPIASDVTALSFSFHTYQPLTNPLTVQAAPPPTGKYRIDVRLRIRHIILQFGSEAEIVSIFNPRN